ncbi:Transmembrane protein 115 [Tetrabaena socialis]|uniref:Transmembrane protein 115 n=1 Tax=Tetrabaena socialis TaxID=47790 RepID=A0A2J7ZQC9_9CHLO|nr:Transmembrane protein 115 [Tetrabaena socialis]|eukprot:PNH02462.1 Transmembrane protein 115 [Tetrabaena socialis]
MVDLRITRLSKVIAALLVALYFVAFFLPETVGYVALIPGRTLPYVWNLLSAGFLTTNPIKLGLEVVAVLMLTRLVEPVYGSKEFLKFLFAVDLSVNVCVLVGVYIYFAVGRDTGDILYTKFTGFHGILAGIVVAVKQVMPEHEAKLFGFLKLTFKFLPIGYVLGAVGLAVGLEQWTYIPFIVLGTYNAWVYLRFFQQQPDSQNWGDASDDFKFSGFFPSFLAPILDPFGYACAVVCRLRHSPNETKAPFAKASQYALPAETADANRRRERGAKALEERLHARGGGDGGAADDVEVAGGAPHAPISSTVVIPTTATPH